MLKLEAWAKGSQGVGIDPAGLVTISAVDAVGVDAVSLVGMGADGVHAGRMLFLSDEAKKEIEKARRAWAFDANGNEFKLTIESLRIRLAQLFDPMTAEHAAASALLGRMPDAAPISAALCSGPTPCANAKVCGRCPQLQ